MPRSRLNELVLKILKKIQIATVYPKSYKRPPLAYFTSSWIPFKAHSTGSFSILSFVLDNILTTDFKPLHSMSFVPTKD